MQLSLNYKTIKQKKNMYQQKIEFIQPNKRFIRHYMF